MIPRHFYQTYGLHIASEIELPELRATSAAPEGAIAMALAALPETLEGAQVQDSYLQVAGDRCQFYVEGIARFRIEQGQRILIDPFPEAAAGDVRAYLLGIAFGALLHQRGLLPLHVSAVATPNGIWAFTGESGAGKSTLAAALHYQFKWPLLSDDVGVIKPCDLGQPVFHPGPPRLKLWQDALNHFEIDSHGLIPDLIRTNKFHLRLERGFEHEPQRLRTLVLLERAEDEEPPRLIPVNGMAAFQTVAGAVYLPEMARRVGDRATLFRRCAALAGQVAVYRYRRPWALARFGVGLQPLFAHLSSFDREHDDPLLCV